MSERPKMVKRAPWKERRNKHDSAKKKEENRFEINPAAVFNKTGSKDKKRKGAITFEDMKFIAANADNMSVISLALALNRTETTIRTYIKEHDLEEVYDDDEEDASIRASLMGEDFWVEVRQQFLASELRYFSSLWTSMVKQFQGDILASEKLQLKKFIGYEILRDRVLKSSAKAIEEIDRLDTEIKKTMKRMKGSSARDTDREIIRSYTDNLVSLRASLPSYSKELNDFNVQQTKLASELKMSRADRISNIQDAEKNWEALIRLFEDRRVREKIGKHIELGRAAAENQKKVLYGYHQFTEHEVGMPVITAESLEYIEKAGNVKKI